MTTKTEKHKYTKDKRDLGRNSGAHTKQKEQNYMKIAHQQHQYTSPTKQMVLFARVSSEKCATVIIT
jgi:hypothetical protein